jgi:oxalate decarboxylase/phosphoglucose isomerase-like protein (cupin superfamily)
MDGARIISFPKILDPRGNLTFLQAPSQLPFDLKRVFWTYDVPGGEIRGGHAYHQQQEIIVALSGSFDVIVRKPDGAEEKFQLNRSYYGLYLPAYTWRHMENFSTNSLALHLANTPFDRNDYIYDYDQYAALSNKPPL